MFLVVSQNEEASSSSKCLGLLVVSPFLKLIKLLNPTRRPESIYIHTPYSTVHTQTTAHFHKKCQTRPSSTLTMLQVVAPEHVTSQSTSHQHLVRILFHHHQSRSFLRPATTTAVEADTRIIRIVKVANVKKVDWPAFCQLSITIPPVSLWST
jgi:hypothetical protein